MVKLKEMTMKEAGFQAVKKNKRLWIKDGDGNLVYTPPNFIRLHNRELFNQLVDRLNRFGYLCILDIMWFESRAPRIDGPAYTGEY